MSADDPIPLDDDADDALELLDTGDEGDAGSSKIQSFARKAAVAAHDWKRGVNTTGTGATRMKTFHAKLRVDALEFLDEQVNAWLDEHPEYEVKLVTTTIGVLTGKMKEEALFMNVWV